MYEALERPFWCKPCLSVLCTLSELCRGVESSVLPNFQILSSGFSLKSQRWHCDGLLQNVQRIPDLCSSILSLLRVFFSFCQYVFNWIDYILQSTVYSENNFFNHRKRRKGSSWTRQITMTMTLLLLMDTPNLLLFTEFSLGVKT